MAAVILRLRVWLRSQWRRCVIVGVFAGLVGGVAMGLAAGSRRTDSAPDRYTRDAGGDPDLLITQLGGAPLTEQTRQLPGVARAQALVFVTAFLLSPVDGSPILEPNPFAGDATVVGAKITAGSNAAPGATDEFIVNETFAALLRERFGTRVGDRFQAAAFDQDQVNSGSFGPDEPPAVPPFTATLVGVASSPSDFDDPSPAMIFPTEFLDAHPNAGVVQSLIAVDVADDADPSAVMDAFRRLPNGAGAYNVPTRVVSPAARRAVQFQVTALWLVTAVSILAAVATMAMIVTRAFRTAADERTSLSAIGWRRRDMIIERSMEGAVIGVIGAAIATGLSAGLTALFPLGILRSFEPSPGARPDTSVSVIGIVAIVAVVVLAAASSVRRAPERGGSRQAATSRRRIPASGSGLALPSGVMLAVSSSAGGRRSLGGLAAGAVAVAGVVGSIIVGSSVAQIVDRPGRWGVAYDQLYGNPYAPSATDIIAPAIDDPLITAVSGATIGSIALNGTDVAMFAVDTVRGNLGPIVLDGRAPAGTEEIALGAEVARRLGVDIGDEVNAVGSEGGTARLTVVGVVVTPDSAGNGSTMTFAGFAAITPSATENLLLVDFVAGAPADVAERVDASAAGGGNLIKPTSVRALQRVTTAPFLLGAVLAGLLVLTCGYVLAMSVRARRADLAVLRALGADGRQLRRIIHWQATLLAAAVSAVGIPAGVAAGRSVVRLVTETLGIVPGAHASVAMLLEAAVSALVGANLLAVLPAQRAARTSAIELLRDR